MNFAFCLFKYFPFGGLQRDFLRITQECLRRGHTVDIYTMQWEGEKDPALSVTILPIKSRQNHTRAQEFADQVSKKLTTKKYDKVVGFNKMPHLDVYYAADTCFQAKAHKKHGLWYRFTPRYRHLVNFENAVFSTRKKTEILLLSPFQQIEFMQYYHTQAERFHVLPPGIARDRIAPANAADIRTELRQEFQIDEEESLLLMVGSGFKTKGLDRILLGLASLNNKTRLFVIGQDNPTLFAKQAAKLNITDRVVFLGGRHDVSRFFLGADLLVHPAYNENTGTVLLEALAAGLPVLTTDVCGYAHYITEAQAGYVLPSPFDQNQFNVMLKNMLLSPDRRQWRENALDFAKQADIYSLPEHAADLITGFK